MQVLRQGHLQICALPTTEPLTWTFYDLPPRTRPRQPGALYQHVGETDSIIWGPLVFKGSRRYVYPLMVKLPRRCLHPPFTPAAFLRTRLDLKSYLMVLSKLPPVVSSFAITGYGQDIPINLRPPEPEVRRNSEDRNRTDLGLAERVQFLVRVGSGSANDIADSNGTIDGGSQESGGPPMTSGFTPINVMAIATTVSQAARGNPELSQFSNLRR